MINFLEKQGMDNERVDDDRNGDGKIKITSYKKEEDGVKVSAYVIEPCLCARRKQTSTKNEEEMEIDKKLLDFLFKERQRSIRKAKLNLAAAETYFELEKIAKKQKK